MIHILISSLKLGYDWFIFPSLVLLKGNICTSILLVSLLESSEDFDSEDTGLQEAEDVDADERRESPRAARQREADALQRRLASLELDAGLPSTDLPDSGETEQKGQDCGIAPDTSVEITLDEQDPFSALAALLTE